MEYVEIKIEDPSQSLLDVLRDQGYFLPAFCGGRGSCGKCKVKLLSVRDEERAGEGSRKIKEISDKEKACLSDREISQDWRLACAVYGTGVYELELPDHKEEEIEAVGYSDGNPSLDGQGTSVESGSGFHKAAEASDQQGLLPDQPALAVDIGTTTIAASLTDTVAGKVVQTVTGINHQRAYGADVLSRIDAANQGRGDKLRDLVIKDLDSLCVDLSLEPDILGLSFPVIISGNTTMQHLLQDLPCQTLGVFPFDPVDISLHAYENMTILPGVSTYVGADIVSGIIACGIDQGEEISILVDLGTNGEMIIGNKNRILAASTAAGPAFEGGNISCGLAGVPGAVDTVEIRKGIPHITTIGGRKAVGLCGTGVLETVYELLKEELMDETGLLEDEYLDEGFTLAEGVTFTAKDIREVQLAKAAIRAGIEILLASYGVTYDQVDRLFLAGGFGRKINVDKAVGIGMLPEELADRTLPVGNSSLKGAVLFAGDPDIRKRFDHVIHISEEINLSNHKLFNDLYVEHMFFPEC